MGIVGDHLKSEPRLATSLGLIVGLCCLRLAGLSGDCSAAPPRGSWSAEPSEQNGAGSSLRFTQDRQVEQTLDSVRGRLDAGDFSSAALLLQQILGSEVATLVSEGESLLSVRAEAARLAARLPDDLRQRFETEMDRIADDRWDDAKIEATSETTADFLRRYRSTRAGLDALRWLAAAQRDASRHELAAAAWAQVVQHPRATKSQRTAAWLARIESLIAAGRLSDAAHVCRDAASVDLEPRRELAGREIVPREWIFARQQELVARQPSLAMDRGQADSVPRLPALRPTWTRNLRSAADLEKNIGEVQRYFRDQGVVSSPALRPLVVGNLVIARTMESLTAFDAASGEPVWTLANHEYAWVAERPKYLEENAIYRGWMASDWHRRTEADSVFGTVSTDGRLAVIVHDPDQKRFQFPLAGAPQRPGPQSGVVPGVRWNRLCGYEIPSKELRWQIDGSSSGQADPFGGTTFLGPPAFVDDLLFGVGRKDDELRLLALDRDTGHLRWSIVLGILPAHLADAASRRRIACPVSLVEGLLLCPTASGALVAVDPVTRSIAWAFRYPTAQHDLPLRPVNGASPPTAPDAWWNEWREVSCVTAKIAGDAIRRDAAAPDAATRDVTLLASPDSNELHAINRRDGTRRWRVARGGALHLAGVFADVAIVIEPMAVRAHDLRTGKLRWRAETGEISGRGSMTGSLLIQPRRAGGVAVVDMHDGSVRAGLSHSDAVFGTLIPCDGGWISQTEQTLQRLPFLDDVRRDAVARWTSEPDDANAVDVANLDLQLGDPIAARNRLNGFSTPRARELHRDSILMLLRQRTRRETNDAAGVSFDRHGLGRELLKLCDSDDERLIALRAMGNAARAADDFVGALTFFLDGLEVLEAAGRRSIGDWPAEDASTRAVRKDRVLLGAIEGLLDEATTRSNSSQDKAAMQTVVQLEQTLDARLTAARQSGDPFAVQQFVDRLMPLEWGRRTLLAESAAALYARPLKKAEPLLLSAAGSRDATCSARATEQLVNLFAKSGWKVEADALTRRLMAEHPGTPLANGHTIAARLATDSTDPERRSRLLAPPRDPWPAVTPEVDVESRRHSDVYQVPISVQADPGSLFDRLDVYVDRQGRSVRFAGDGHGGTWEVMLPGDPKPLRSGFANLDQVEAYSVGRLLVLRVGSEVFGVAPLDDRGEPHGAVTSLQFDMAPMNADLPQESWWTREVVPARLGIRHEGVRLVDGFGRTLGGLGPVRPGYLCYRSLAKLVAMDTQTGRRLWERLDLPPNCVAFGDDDRVFLWRTAEKSLQILSAIDGRSLEERAWDVSPDDVLMQHGGRTWVARRHPVAGIELHDARDNSVVWSRWFSPNAIPFAVDRDTVGVVESAGLLHLLSADTGAPLGEALSIDVPEKLERIVCVHDAQRWYLAFSGPVLRLPALQAEQVWGGTRMAFVHGWLYGIDRRNASIVWRRWLEDEPVSVNASRVAPVLVQLWRVPNPDGTAPNAGDGRLKLIDKRTGREVFSRRNASLQPYFVMFENGNREKLDVHLERESLRLHYNLKVEDPTAPDK